jgi:hypothetical protein
MHPRCGAGNLAFRALCRLGRGGGPYDFDRIIASNGTLFEHPGKDPLAGHNAVSGLVIDRAAVVPHLSGGDVGDDRRQMAQAIGRMQTSLRMAMNRLKKKR